MSDYAASLGELAQNALRRRDLDTALARIEDAHEVLRVPLTIAPGAARLVATASFVLDTHAQVLRERNDMAGALARSVDAIEMVVRRLRSDPRNVEVANNANDRLGTLTRALDAVSDASQSRARCVQVAAELTEIAAARPELAHLQQPVAAALDCAAGARNQLAGQAAAAEIVAGSDRDRLDGLMRRHGDYLLAAFANPTRRIEDDYEFHARMGRALRYRWQLAERDGDLDAAERYATGLAEALAARRPDLDYDLYAMQQLTAAHRDLARFRAARGDRAGRAHHLVICADPARAPYPSRDCMDDLARMMETGELGPGQEARAREVRARIPHHRMLRFTIPLRESPGSPTTFPFHVYLPPPIGFDGIDNQVLWLRRSRGLEVASDIVESFQKIHRIARENNVSFPDLAEYALGSSRQGSAPPPPPSAEEMQAWRRLHEAATGLMRNPRVSTDRAGITIGGQDPVAYLRDGRVAPGNPAHFAIQDGAIWLFVSADNAAAFRAEPARYMPQFGGYCASCLALGTKRHASPQVYVIRDGQLYLHSTAQLRDQFRDRALSREPAVEAAWRQRQDEEVGPAPDTESTRRLLASRPN